MGRQGLDASPFLDDGDHIVSHRFTDRRSDVDGWTIFDAAGLSPDVGHDLVEGREKIFASAGGEFDGGEDVDHKSWTLFGFARFVDRAAAAGHGLSDLR